MALLEPTTHFTEEAIWAVLATDFKDDLAILAVTVRRDRSSTCDGSERFIDRLHYDQPLAPATARLAIGVYHKSAMTRSFRDLNDDEII